METQNKQVQKTIGDIIDQKIKSYMDLYNVLVEVGNKRPASVILTEAFLNEKFVSDRLLEKLHQELDVEAKKEKWGGGHKIN